MIHSLAGCRFSLRREQFAGRFRLGLDMSSGKWHGLEKTIDRAQHSYAGEIALELPFVVRRLINFFMLYAVHPQSHSV